MTGLMRQRYPCNSVLLAFRWLIEAGTRIRETLSRFRGMP
jgi:hypothetical protein